MSKKILMCGGGTLGPVTPLLAVKRRMEALNAGLEFAWVGTPDGPEKSLIAREGMPFYSVKTAKLPRYPSLAWISFPFDFLQASRQAAHILKLFKPDLVVGAGGFTQVPVMRQALKRRISCAVHQLDRDPVRSNSFLAPRSAMVTSSLSMRKGELAGKAQKIKTPCRFAGITLPSKKDAAQYFKLDASRPIIFVTGGGTGALTLNRAVREILPVLLARTQMIHLTGTGKGEGIQARPGYYVSEAFNETEMLNAFAAADLVISRGGFGTLSELAALQKPAVIVPLPGPQMSNARALKGAIVNLIQEGDFAQRLQQTIFELLNDANKREMLGKNLDRALPTDNGKELAEKWVGLL